MSTLDRFEEQSILPVITREFKNRPDGLTLDEIKGSLHSRGITKTRERLLMICAVLEVAGFCSMQRDCDVIRFVPNTELYSAPAIIH